MFPLQDTPDHTQDLPSIPAAHPVEWTGPALRVVTTTVARLLLSILFMLVIALPVGAMISPDHERLPVPASASAALSDVAGA